MSDQKTSISKNSTASTRSQNVPGRESSQLSSGNATTTTTSMSTSTSISRRDSNPSTNNSSTLKENPNESLANQQELNDAREEGQMLVTRNELQEMRKEISLEIQTMVDDNRMHFLSVFKTLSEMSEKISAIATAKSYRSDRSHHRSFGEDVSSSASGSQVDITPPKRRSKASRAFDQDVDEDDEYYDNPMTYTEARKELVLLQQNSTKKKKSNDKDSRKDVSMNNVTTRRSSGINEDDDEAEVPKNLFPKGKSSKISGLPDGDGSGDDPDSSDGDKRGNRKKDEDAKKKKLRRESLMMRQFRQTGQSLNIVQYTAPVPEYKHIRLSALTVTAIKTFLDAILQYQTAYRIEIPVVTLIDQNVREQLIAREDGFTSIMFYELSTEELIMMLKEQIRPSSKLAFKTALERSTEFPALPVNYRPSVINFQVFYDALLSYKKSFLFVYEILAEDNDQNIPHVTNKEGGLLKSFIDRIPYKYGFNTFQSIKKANEIDNFYTFLRRFYKITDEHYTSYKVARSMQLSFSGTDYFSKNVFQKNRSMFSSSNSMRNGSGDRSSNGSQSHTNRFRLHNSGRRSSFSSPNNRQNLGNVQHRPTDAVFQNDEHDVEMNFHDEIVQDSIYDDEYFRDLSTSLFNDVGDDGVQHDDVEDYVAQSEDSLERDILRDDVDYNNNHEGDELFGDHDEDNPTSIPNRSTQMNLNNIKSGGSNNFRNNSGKVILKPSVKNSSSASNTLQKRPDLPRGCFQMLFYGTCQNGDRCKYSHDRNTLSRSYTDYAKMLDSSKFKPSSGVMKLSYIMNYRQSSLDGFGNDTLPTTSTGAVVAGANDSPVLTDVYEKGFPYQC